MDDTELRSLWTASIPLDLEWEALATGQTLRPVVQTLTGDATVLAEPPPSSPEIAVRVRAADARTLDAADVRLPTFAVRAPGREGRDAEHPSLPSPPSEPAAPFELLEEIGRGGMGVVYRARQPSLGREVAVKRLLAEHRSDAVQGQFVAEARVTGILDHPNIVPVYELARDAEGEVFLAMKLVHGTSWKDLLHPRTEAQRQEADRTDLAAHLRILLSVCNAIAFAHSRDICHRDLKPENIMIGAFGEVLVMDWGIACDVSDPPRPRGRIPHRLALSGPAGTPAYMPPELARADGPSIDGRTDVYLLGGILYEVVTGEAPHGSGGLFAVLRRAASGHVPEIDDRFPQELGAICRRALAPAGVDRYPDVGALQSAVETFLAHRESQRIAGAAYETLARVQREATRGPQRVPGAAGHRRAGRREPSDRTRLYAGFAEAVAAFRQARVLWNGNDLASSGERKARLHYARTALRSGDLGLAESQLAEMPDDEPAVQKLWRDLAQRLAARDRQERRLRWLRRSMTISAALVIAALGTGFWLVRRQARRTEAERDRAVAAETEARAARGDEAQARTRAVESGWRARLLAARGYYGRSFRYTDHGRTRPALACLLRAVEIAPPGGAPSGLSFAAGEPTWAEEAWLRYRYLEASRPRLDFGLLAHQGPARALSIYRYGRRAVTVGDDGRVRIWDLLSGALLGERRFEGGPIRAAALSPDETSVALAKPDGAIELLLLADRRPLRTLGGPRAVARQLAFTPSGRELLVAHEDGAVRVWDLTVFRAKQRPSEKGGPALAIVAGPAGKVALSGGADGVVRIWSIASGAVVQTLRGHRGWVSGIALVDGGRWVLSGSYDKTMRLWDPLTGEEKRRFSGHEQAVLCVWASRNGRLLASGSMDGSIRLYAADTGRLLHVWQTGGGEPWALASTPDDDLLLAATADGLVRAWDLSGIRERATLEGHRAAVTSLALTAGGRVVSGCRDGRLQVFDPEREQVAWADLPGAILGLAPLRKDRVLVATETAPRPASPVRLAVYALPGGDEIEDRGVAPGPLVGLCADTAGRRVLLAAEDGRFLVMGQGPTESRGAPADGEAPAGEPAPATAPDGAAGETDGAGDLRVPVGVRAIAISGDGRTAAFGGADGTVRIWDLDRRREVQILRGHRDVVLAVALDDAGGVVASGARDGTARVWRLPEGVEQRRLLGHRREVGAIALSASGRVVATGSADGTARVWDAVTGQPLRTLHGHGRRVTAVAFSRAGDTLTTAGLDGTVRLWSLLGGRLPAVPPSFDPDDAQARERALAPLYDAVGVRVIASGPSRGAIVPIVRGRAVR